MILIDNRQNKVEVTEELENIITAVIEHTLTEESVDLECEVSVVFVDNNEIREINRECRNIWNETDVLSFPMLEYPKNSVFKDVYVDYDFDDSYFDDGKLVLGDMALSLEKVKEQSEEYGHSFQREAAYLTVHSMLHLLGYDHMKEEEKKIMREREEEILMRFNLTR